MKLAVIGGGSTYTPELADGIGRLLPGVEELVLVDPDPSRLAAVGPVSARIMAAHGHPARVRWTGSLDDGADGADAILFQLRIGGQAARQRDETWPLDCGCVGQETTGAGGLAKALRTVPIVLDLAERARCRASPSAFIIDFTNPVGIVTRALLSAGHRAVGLCNVAIGFKRDFASLLGVSADRVSLGHVGLNHLTWERSVCVDGADVLPELLDKHADQIAPHTGMTADFIRHLGMVPCTTCATTTLTTRWSSRCAARSPAPRRSPGWRPNSLTCTRTRRWIPSRPSSRSAAARGIPRRRWTCSSR